MTAHLHDIAGLNMFSVPQHKTIIKSTDETSALVESNYATIAKPL